MHIGAKNVYLTDPHSGKRGNVCGKTDCDVRGSSFL